MRSYLLLANYTKWSVRRLASLPKCVSDSMPSGYDPSRVETGWYEWWQENEYFERDRSPPGAPFSLTLPPPNITGTLHVGHALTCAIQDALVRWNRMKGRPSVWYPGCDHAGIATQVIVEKNLKAQGQDRREMGRDRFLQEVWKWKADKEEIIFKQMKTLGSTLKWEKSVFTLDPSMCRAVNEAFIRLHDSGKICRRESLVNWSCQLQTAISDIEVDHRPLDGPTLIRVPGHEDPVRFGRLYQFAYKLAGNESQEVVVSTTRPETMIGDTAVAVHPEDARYSQLIGRLVHHPVRMDKIPIIADSSVDPQFGTGALKITPAHDLNDYRTAESHRLPMINIFDDRGRANENCSFFAGLPRFELRSKIVEFLSEQNLLKGAIDHAMSVPICSRSGDVIEPLLRPQWFVNTQQMASRAVEAVEKGQLKIVPAHFENVWFDWLRNIKDWCISRQLWWGHRIPAYRCRSADGSCTWVAAHDQQEAARKAQALGLTSLVVIEQEEDVLDTWFSSGLFPFAVCGWPEQTADLERFFPLSIMETGHDILFFWVARMVMLSLELTDRLPFEQVVLHGIICDSQGRKMSKSLGNVIDPQDVIHGASLRQLEAQLESSRKSGHLSPDEHQRALEEKRKRFPEGIPAIGADALRFTLCSYNVKNHFINLDMATMRRNRLFCNKIWQATRFLFLLLERSPDIKKEDWNCLEDGSLPIVHRWILGRLHNMVDRINSGMASYDFHHATDAIYHFLYSQLCDVYLEAIKPLTGQNQRISVLVLVLCLDVALRSMAPFMPYLSEELYQRLHSQLQSRQIDLERWRSTLIARFPEKEEWSRFLDEDLTRNFDLVMQCVAELRAMKLQYGMTKSKPEGIWVCSLGSIQQSSEQYRALIQTLAGLETLHILPDWTGPSGKKWASRTVEGCAVHMSLAENFNEELELKKCRDKIRKLSENLKKLETTTSAPSYGTNAPLHIQEMHRNKIARLREDISQLDSYCRALQGSSTV